MVQTRWGDEDDDSVSSSDQPKTTASGIILPPTQVSRLEKGVKTVTSYKPHPSNPNQLTEVTSKVKVIVIANVREHISVETRRKWKPFGDAKDVSEAQRSNVTIVTREDVFMEDPNADVEPEDASKALAGNLNAFWAKQQRRQLERKYDVPEDEKGEDGGWTKVGGVDKAANPAAASSAAGAGASTGKYIPPSLRSGAISTGKSLSERESSRSQNPSASSDRDQNTIRVTNISEDTKEEDLQELFANFGRISRVYLAKDKETLQSRGFAFVSFARREDAQLAMDKLQGYGYDHLILKLEWARPSAPRDPGSEGTQFRSGYGKALAQDTTERVSYASNLTRGVR